jgi:hypothetical protein
VFNRITSGSDIREGSRREDGGGVLIWQGFLCVGCVYPAVSGGPSAGGCPEGYRRDEEGAGGERCEGGKAKGWAVRQVLVVGAEESAEIPNYQRSSASIRGSVFLLPVDGSGQDAQNWLT